MTQITHRQRETNTVWTVEALLKDAADVEAYLAVPDEAFTDGSTLGRWRPRNGPWAIGGS